MYQDGNDLSHWACTTSCRGGAVAREKMKNLLSVTLLLIACGGAEPDPSGGPRSRLRSDLSQPAFNHEFWTILAEMGMNVPVYFGGVMPLAHSWMLTGGLKADKPRSLRTPDDEYMELPRGFFVRCISRKGLSHDIPSDAAVFRDAVLLIGGMDYLFIVDTERETAMRVPRFK